MNPVSISVIVPVYNEEKYIAECLDSVIHQSFGDIEILVVDDAGTDSSISIVQDYLKLDDRIKLLKHDANKGRGEARNTGIDHSRGKYIFFLDSDDSLPPDALGTLYTAAEHFASNVVYGKTISRKDVDAAFVKCDLYNISIHNFPNLVFCHSAWNKLIERERLVNCGIRFVPPRYAEDILFSLKVNLEFDAITIINKGTYNYRWGRQIDTASKEKVLNAQSNVLKARKLVKSRCDRIINRSMDQKTARTIYSSMVRAIIALDRVDLENYLENWHQVVNDLDDYIYKLLPPDVAKFCNLIARQQYGKAISYWKVSQRLKIANRATGIVKNGLYRLLRWHT